MTNINPAPPQNNFNDSMMPSVDAAIQPPIAPPLPQMTNPQSPVSSEQPNLNKVKSTGSGSNKLWIILLVLLAMVIGFWIGYFTNEYFFQSAQDQLLVPPPITDRVFEPIDDFEPEPMEVNKEFIIFKDEQNYLNDGLNFISQEQCVEDEIAMLTAIEDDYITIQINQWTLQEDSGEYTAELVDYQLRDQECLTVRPICMDVFIERCFSLENIDGVYSLDYEFRQEGTMPLTPDLEPVL